MEIIKGLDLGTSTFSTEIGCTFYGEGAFNAPCASYKPYGCWFLSDI